MKSMSSDARQATSVSCLTVCEAASRVLRRTALSLATTPGGLRFVPGSRPWLQGVPRVATRTCASLSPVKEFQA